MRGVSPISADVLLWDELASSLCGGHRSGVRGQGESAVVLEVRCHCMSNSTHTWITGIQWNLSIKDTLNCGHLSNEGTVCSPNHIDLCVQIYH